MFESAGLENVQIYIESGNVIFESDEDAASLAKQIERQLEKAAEYKIEVFVRAMREVKATVQKSPFTVKGTEMVYIAFFHKNPR